MPNPNLGRKFGADLKNLRGGVLKELRPGAAEASDVSLRAPGLKKPTADTVRTKIMEAAYDAMKKTPGFDPTVAGSASFKLKW